MRLAPPPEEPEVPGQFWKDFIRDTAPEFRKPTIVQLETFLQPTWQALIDGSMYVNDRLSEIFDELAAGRDRRGQRGRVRGDPRERQTVGADRVLQPVRGEGRADPARLLRLSDRGHVRLERRSGRSTTACWVRRSPRSTRGSASTARRRSRARATTCTSRRSSTCTCSRRRRTTGARPSSRRRGIGWTRACATDAPFDVDAALPGARAARLPVARLARIGRRRADATPDRRAGRDRLPRDRQQGPAARAARRSPTTCSARSSCRSRRSCRRSTWSSRTAATTP